jgi:hypothetical protein
VTSAQPQVAFADFDRCIAPQHAGKLCEGVAKAEVGQVAQSAHAQYLRDMTAADALGDRCFFDAMGEVIAGRLKA